MVIRSNPISSLVAHVASRGDSPPGRRRSAVWAARQPVLARYSSPGEAAAAVRAARGGDQDRLVAALVSVAAGDELAQLTVVAGLAGRLTSVVAIWRRAGVASDELLVLPADLVASAWMATAGLAGSISRGGPMPSRVAWHIVDEAREMVRVPRRRDRRRSTLVMPFDELASIEAPPVERSAGESLAVVLAAAVRTGRLSRAAAAPVFLTRVAGFPVSETAVRLGCSESTVRAVRWRTERRLAAA